MTVQSFCDSAVTHHQQGRLAEAEALYLQVLAREPRNFTANHLLGVLRSQQGRYDEALTLIGAALKLQPRQADAHSNYGNVLLSLERYAEALASYDRALALQPGHAHALYNHGNALLGLERWAAAVEAFDKALAVNPNSSGAWGNRALALCQMDQLEAASASQIKALALDPRNPELLHQRGVTFSQLQNPAEALAHYDRALALKPDGAALLFDRAVALRDLGRLEDAMASADAAIARDPDHAPAHWHKGLCALALGNFAQGWPLYEWRKRQPRPMGAERFDAPLWTGAEDLSGKTLFIHAEQGLGDTIQFCRYALLAKARRAHVILGAQDSLLPLLKPLGVELIGLRAQAPACDYHIALLSMPLAFGTDANTIPANVPYLFAEPERVAAWRERIGSHGFRIGIVWQGSKGTLIEKGRSFSLSHFAALANLPDVRLISLQKDEGGPKDEMPPGLRVEDLGPDFDAEQGAFLDCAAVMENLDLVIAPDTSVAHLAGALGRPVWRALQKVPDWRWGLTGSQTPWYPTMRLFRQRKAGDWTGVFAQLREALIQLRSGA